MDGAHPLPLRQQCCRGGQYGATRFTELCREPLLVVDCAAVVANAAKPHKAKSFRNPAAGLWKWIPQEYWPTVLKTKAHRTKEAAIKEDDLQNWIGNDMADRAAKEAALAGERPSILEDVKLFVDRATALIRGVIEIVAAFPRFTPPVVTKEVTARHIAEASTRAIRQPQHESAAIPGTDRTMCTRCFAIASVRSP